MAAKELHFEDLMNKTLLVGLTYCKKDGETAGRRQFWGTVVQADEEAIAIRRSDGEVVTLPPDLRSIQPAEKGEYRLQSTGETVVDPDFTSSWSVYLKS